MDRIKKHRSHISGARRFLASRMGKKLVDRLASTIEKQGDPKKEGNKPEEYA